MTTRRVEKESVLYSKEPETRTGSLHICQSYIRENGGLIPVLSKHSTPNQEHADVIKDGDSIPGETVRSDQYECRIRELFPHTRGREDPPAPQKLL